LEGESLEWSKLVPRPKSKFYLVECSSCGNAQIIFSHVSKVVKCNVCGQELARPTGGKAEIKGKIIRIFG